MGRVLTEAMIENLKDLWDAERGMIPAQQVRRINVSDALVDTGATLLSLPTRVIQELGLKEIDKKRVTSSSGSCEASIYEAVRLTIQGRKCTMDVMEVPDDVPVLIGQIPTGAPGPGRRSPRPPADRQPGPRWRARQRDVLLWRFVGQATKEPIVKTIRVIANVDERHRLSAEVPASVPPGPVEVMLMFPSSDEDEAGSAWMEGIAHEWAEDLGDSRQDIYSMEDENPRGLPPCSPSSA